MTIFCWGLLALVIVQLIGGGAVLFLTWRKPDRREKPKIIRVK